METAVVGSDYDNWAVIWAKSGTAGNITHKGVTQKLAFLEPYSGMVTLKSKTKCKKRGLGVRFSAEYKKTNHVIE